MHMKPDLATYLQINGSLSSAPRSSAQCFHLHSRAVLFFSLIFSSSISYGSRLHSLMKEGLGSPLFAPSSLWHYSNTSQTFVFIKAPPQAANRAWTVPGHSREGQFCWSGAALGTQMPPLHHLPEGACCSLLLSCHLLQRQGSCPSLLPIPAASGFSRESQKTASATLTLLFIPTSMRFTCRVL